MGHIAVIQFASVAADGRERVPRLSFSSPRLPTTGLHLQWLLWSRQNQKSYDRCQSEAEFQLSRTAGSKAAYPVSRLGSPKSRSPAHCGH